jgi:hypothetical protein
MDPWVSDTGGRPTRGGGRRRSRVSRPVCVRQDCGSQCVQRYAPTGNSRSFCAVAVSSASQLSGFADRGRIGGSLVSPGAPFLAPRGLHHASATADDRRPALGKAAVRGRRHGELALSSPLFRYLACDDLSLTSETGRRSNYP